MSKSDLYILHLISSAGPGSFGLGQVAMNILREQNLLGNNAEIWTLDNEADRQWAADSFGVSIDRIRRFAPSWPGMLRWSREMESTAEKAAKGLSVVHLHALWTGLSRIPNQLRKKFSIPTVITPHGALQKKAMQSSRWKKKIALTLYEGSDLNNAACFHAVGENEISDIRSFGLNNPVAVIPNGISATWLESQGDAESFKAQHGIPADKRVLLYLSRITPIKGLPMFLEALHENQNFFSDWHFVIAGSDEFNHLAEVQSVIAQKKMESGVTFVGSMDGQSKRNAFAAADLFVLPSYSEGSPMVILEALGASVPVLSTNASPWQELEEKQCGWLVDISAKALAEGLREAMQCTPEELKLMGMRGKELVATKYTWAKSAQMTIELYEWLLHRRERPDFVVID
ncbi:MAG: glycosyltransferase [Chlorobium sp.]|nr:glycosyltransferase [Chlorobium sp.]